MAGCAIVGALLLNMVLGTPSSWGSFTVYVTSYLRLSNPNIRYEDTAWVTATSGAMVGFVSFIGGMLLDRWGPRPTALLGSVVLSLGVLASAWTVKYGFLPFFFDIRGGLWIWQRHCVLCPNEMCNAVGATPERLGHRFCDMQFWSWPYVCHCNSDWLDKSTQPSARGPAWLVRCLLH